MEPFAHLTVHQLQEAELVRWAEQVRTARERLAARPPAPAQPAAAHREPSRWVQRLRRSLTGPAARRSA